MSKSYSRRERRERRQDAARSRMSVEYARQPDQPDVITPEWAVGRMAEHINYELEQLIEGRRIRIEDKPELAAAIKERICKSLPAYDEGKSSAVHFLTVVVDNEMSHIRAALDSMKRNIETKPIAFMTTEEARALGYISEETLSDGSKCIRDLEFRMDVKVLRGMLRPLELRVLDLRLQEFTHEEIGERIGLSRFQVMRLMKRIRSVARKCGFVPPSEVRKGAI